MVFAVVSWSACELRLQVAEVLLLLFERGLRGVRGRLRLDHLLLGDLLQAIALGAGDDGLVAQRLGGVARRDGVGVHRLVALDQLVHGAEAGEQIVGARGGAGEEQLERGVVAAVAVELGGDAAGLLRGFEGERGLLVGLALQLVGAVGGVVELLLGDVVLVGPRLGLDPRALDLGGQRGDEPLDAGDLARLRGLVRLGAFCTSSHEG